VRRCKRRRGESQPAEKGVGAEVFASTVVLSGRIHIRTEKTGSETVAAQIAQILSQTKDFKSHVRSQHIPNETGLTLWDAGGERQSRGVGGGEGRIALLP